MISLPVCRRGDQMMHRRAFIFGIAFGLATGSLVAKAQPAGKVYRVGFVVAVAPVSEIADQPNFIAFVQALRALGYIEGQNLILERRSAEGRPERYGDLFGELVRVKADVIVTVGNAMTRAAKAVTTTIPIVMESSADPVGEGLVQSLARPGGNITGLSVTVALESAPKRLELLRDALPGVSRVVFFESKEDNSWESPVGEILRRAARVLGMTLILVKYTPYSYTEAFTQVSRARADALYVTNALPAFFDRALIADFATRARLPSTFPWREAVELGGLMSYGVNNPDMFRRAAGYVDKILKGAKPADLPVEQPTRLEFVINMKTAKALGITIPQSVLLRADELIE
jgi:putative tryptophan/tyrosine transport system substrate-binding protein